MLNIGAVHSYDANRVIILYGLVPIGDLAPETIVDIVYNDDLHILEKGCDRESALYQTNDMSARVTIRVLPNSYANLLFTAALMGARAVKIGSFPLLIMDLNTLTTHASRGAWIKKPPRKVYARDMEALEWELETHELEAAYGHNPFNGGLLDFSKG